MISLKGYVKGNAVIADGFIGNIYDGKEVIVTILDSFRSKKKKTAAKKRYTAEDAKAAFGLWKNHSDSENVPEYVISMRRGRRFGI